MLDRAKGVVNLVRVKPLVTFRARRALQPEGNISARSWSTNRGKFPFLLNFPLSAFTDVSLCFFAVSPVLHCRHVHIHSCNFRPQCQRMSSILSPMSPHHQLSEQEHLSSQVCVSWNNQCCEKTPSLSSPFSYSLSCLEDAISKGNYTAGSSPVKPEIVLQWKKNIHRIHKIILILMIY